MKPKILFVMHTPPPVNGAAMVGKYIKESMIINTEFEADYINLSTSKSLTEVGDKSIGKVITLFKIQLKVIYALLDKDYDLCYVTLSSVGPGFYKDLFIVSLLKIFGRKIIYHFHNKGVSSGNKSQMTDLLYRYALKNTFSILLSKRLFYDIEGYVNYKNVFYCANGIHESKTIAREIKAVKDVHVRCRLLFLGNMIEQKGIFVLLEVCKILKKMSLSFECHFVGGWADISPVAFQSKIAEYGLDDVIFAQGPKYEQEKAAFLEDSDIFVFPTFYKLESFPLVVLEAMKYRLPVIAYDEGGIPDMVVEGKTGFIFAQGEVEAMAEKIKILIEDPILRARMGSAGRERFDELFRLELFEKNMKDILSAAISTNPV